VPTGRAAKPREVREAELSDERSEAAKALEGEPAAERTGEAF